MAKASKSKRHNLAYAKREPKVDRISELPDEIICHILSFVSTKEAVATGALSTRWKSLWTFVQTLEYKDNWPCFYRRNFKYVVRRVFAQRQTQCIKRLLFSSYLKCYDPDFINELVSIAVEQNIEELDISFYYHYKATLPNTLFTCKTISVLKLGWTINLNVPSYVNLPLLKVLHLYLHSFVDGESIMRFFAGCPILEELYYQEKFWRPTSFIICVPSLKKLHVKSRDRILQIDTPSLHFFQLEKTKVIDYMVGDMPNLVEAYVDLFLDLDEKENIFKLFNGIHQTKFLCLSTRTTEVLAYAGLKFPVFCNLVHLRFYFITLDSYFIVESLLQNCPKLEVLDILKGEEADEAEIEWTQPTTEVPHYLSSHLSMSDNCDEEAEIEVPRCLSSHLTMFKFRGYGGSEDELELAGYILKHGKVLKETMFQFVNWLKPNEKRSARSQLYELPRGSKYTSVTKYYPLN